MNFYITAHSQQLNFPCTVKLDLKCHSKKTKTWVFKIDYRLVQVKSVAECSKRAFCSTFDLHQATICL